MTNEQQRVRAWLQKGGIKFADKPTELTLEERKVCAKLLLEECLETIQEGLGLKIGFTSALKHSVFSTAVEGPKNFIFAEGAPPSLVKLADGLGDTKYVANYIATKHGIDLEPVEQEICDSNDSKFRWTQEELAIARARHWIARHIGNGQFCVTDESGKIRKSDSYTPANVAAVLEKQGAEGRG